MSVKILILNAPKMAGKDVIADYLVSKYHTDSCHVLKVMFKERLVEAAILMAGVSKQEWDRHYERDLKEVPWELLVVSGRAVSPRDYLIHLSENVFKKIIGEDVFGKAAEKSITDIHSGCPDIDKIFIFSDSGFETEAYPLINITKDIKLARIHRQGHTFDGDSRDYIDPDWLTVDSKRDFWNNSTIECISEEIWQW